MKVPNHKPQNFVHKHSMQLNIASVQLDKKKASKRGYQKHKKGLE